MFKYAARSIVFLACSISSLTWATQATDSGLVADSYLVTFKKDSNGNSIIKKNAQNNNSSKKNGVPFGEHSTGQDKKALATTLGVNGDIASIFETIDSAHIRMSAAEADKLRKHPSVADIEQNRITTSSATNQYSPGWALDRLDQTNTTSNTTYSYTLNGAGQTVYVLDSGLDLSVAAVASEFGGRATVIYDVNAGGTGADCNGHGTKVASAVGGATHGVAKGATLIIAKITSGCTGNADTATWALAFNWLAANAPRGTIVNLSSALTASQCAGPKNPVISNVVESAIRAAYNAGIIVTIAAGNDGCNTAYYTPTRQPESFVVGATDSTRLALGQDARAWDFRIGSNISGFAPGGSVSLLNLNGQTTIDSGTSFAAPYVAGVFAIACQGVAPYCSQANTGDIYNNFKNAAGTSGTVTEPDGSALIGGATSRFISKKSW